MNRFKFWAPVLAGGLLLGIGGAFFAFGVPPEVVGALQKVKNLVGQNVCPPGTEKGKFLEELPPANPLWGTSARQEKTFCVAPAAMQEPEWKPIF